MTPELYLPFVLTFLLSFKHAMDGDHLLATSNYIVRSKSITESLKVTSFWVAGHQTSSIPFATVALLLATQILPIENVIDVIVGCMMIFLGAVFLMSDFGLLRTIIHEHPHSHSTEEIHQHPHPHRFWPLSSLVHWFHRHKHAQLYAIGTVHGLASNDEMMATFAILLGLIAVGGFDLVNISIIVAIYTIGLLAGMFTFATLLSGGVRRSANFPKLFKGIRVSAEALTLTYGIMMLLGLEGFNLIGTLFNIEPG
ncbi:MAG: hypothetical protein NZ920_02165 [Aigarchaeota archaeon]|nr:hypothetical protein [Aigarchaeota archaeon]MDW8092569.1 hypothetical protein [Nitrososphaerota archaeon]